jgi:hypothetical protein
VPKLSEKQREDILAVSSQRDEEIDYSEIPPIREIPAHAVRGRSYRGRAIYLTDELRALPPGVVSGRKKPDACLTGDGAAPKIPEQLLPEVPDVVDVQEEDTQRKDVREPES